MLENNSATGKDPPNEKINLSVENLNYSCPSEISISMTESSTNSEHQLPKEPISQKEECEVIKNDQYSEDDLSSTDDQNTSSIYDQRSMEKLSVVFEQLEDSASSLTLAESLQLSKNYQNFDSSNILSLRNRIQTLDELFASLKEEIRKEVDLWKREREAYQALREKNEALALEQARAAAAAYAVESPLSSSALGDLVIDITHDDTLRELTILEYEKKLAKMNQDEFSFALADKRYNARWKLIANAYRQKLIEVEKLCNEELEKVQRSANCLEPLKKMASQWCSVEENSHGDYSMGTKSTQETQKFNIQYFNEELLDINYYNFQKIDAEVNMTPEIVAARFNDY